LSGARLRQHERRALRVGLQVDAADATALGYSTTDITGATRYDTLGVTNPGNGVPNYADMGAYEYGQPAWKPGHDWGEPPAP